MAAIMQVNKSRYEQRAIEFAPRDESNMFPRTFHAARPAA